MHLIDMILDFSPTISKKKTLKNACAIFKNKTKEESRLKVTFFPVRAEKSICLLS